MTHPGELKKFNINGHNRKQQLCCSNRARIYTRKSIYNFVVVFKENLARCTLHIHLCRTQKRAATLLIHIHSFHHTSSFLHVILNVRFIINIQENISHSNQSRIVHEPKNTDTYIHCMYVCMWDRHQLHNVYVLRRIVFHWARVEWTKNYNLIFFVTERDSGSGCSVHGNMGDAVGWPAVPELSMNVYARKYNFRKIYSAKYSLGRKIRMRKTERKMKKSK